MKRIIVLLLCLVLTLSLSGCEKSTAETPVPSKEVNSAQSPTATPTKEPEEVPDPTPTPEPTEIPEESSDGIDVDLTILSGTVCYAKVYNMMVYPEDYIGKTVKMQGTFDCYHDNTTGNDYFACVINDATACCAQGIEFVLTDDYVYPDDYPEINSEICVIGVFDSYKEGEYIYYTLRDASLS